MIFLNNLTNNGTCESVDIIKSGKPVAHIEFKEGQTLTIKNHILGVTDEMRLYGVIDTGIWYNFQAYNNRIKVSKYGEKPYRGADR